MWDKIEKLFPSALPAIQRQHPVIRVVLLIAVAALSFVGLKILVFQGPTIQLKVGLLGVIILAALFVGVAVSLAIMQIRRSRLRSFVRQWVTMREHIMLLHTRIETWTLEPNRAFDDPNFVEIMADIKTYAARRAPLRRLLFVLGEKNLVATDNQRWRELKSQEAIFKERDYLTPFGFLLDLDAPIYSVNHHGHAVWAALFISDDFVEYLRYKYRFLRNAAA
jgi:hypothetical protein